MIYGQVGASIDFFFVCKYVNLLFIHAASVRYAMMVGCVFFYLSSKQ